MPFKLDISDDSADPGQLLARASGDVTISPPVGDRFGIAIGAPAVFVATVIGVTLSLNLFVT